MTAREKLLQELTEAPDLLVEEDQNSNAIADGLTFFVGRYKIFS